MYRSKHKVNVKYVPHGIKEEKFFPIDENHPEYDEMIKYRNKLFDTDEQPSFVLLYNSRNIRRKMTNDVLLSYKLFCDKLSKEDAQKCVLILHTQPIDENGTNLIESKSVMCPKYKVVFTNQMVDTKTLNFLYNIVDTTINIASNEGWGLSTSESLLCGTPIIVNVTGGLQDQCRFEDENGNWINFTPDFPSNHDGTIIKCGEWAIPIFPSSRSLQGSVPTPYIFDDRCRLEDVRNAMLKMYSFGRTERKRRGMSGHKWVKTDEAKITASKMCESFIDAMEKTIVDWTPQERFSLYDTKINDGEKKVAFNVQEESPIDINKKVIEN